MHREAYERYVAADDARKQREQTSVNSGEMKMAKFKVGDKVRLIKAAATSVERRIVTLEPGEYKVTSLVDQREVAKEYGLEFLIPEDIEGIGYGLDGSGSTIPSQMLELVDG